MQRETLREWLKRQPFQPFRVYLTDGRVYKVRYPRMNLLAQAFIKIGIPAPDIASEMICDHTEYGALNEIASIQPLPSGASTQPT